MFAYSYDRSGLYTGVVKCQPCKVRVGEFLVPGHATLVKPPEPVPGKSIVWNGVKWEYRPAPKPREIVVQEKVVTEEVRDDERLLTIMIGNLRGEFQSEFNKAVGVLRSAVLDLGADLEKRTAVWKKESQKVLVENEEIRNRLDGLEQELSIVRTQFKNLGDEFRVLLEVSREMDEKLLAIAKRVDVYSVVDEPASSEKSDVVVSGLVETKSKWKFWS